MRPEEHKAASILECHVRRRLPESTVVLEEGQDPPDFWLSIDGKRFVVEITSLVEGMEHENNVVKRDHIIARVAQKVEASARGEGSLVGQYAILPFGDIDVPAQLDVMLLSCVRSLKGAVPVHCERVRCPRGWIEVCKVHENGASIQAARIGNAKFEGEVVDDVRAMLSNRLIEKRDKLNRPMIRSHSSGDILVLLDRYSFATPNQFKNALSSMGDPEAFVAIFLVKANRQGDWHKRIAVLDTGSMLYAQNPRW